MLVPLNKRFFVLYVGILWILPYKGLHSAPEVSSNSTPQTSQSEKTVRHKDFLKGLIANLQKEEAFFKAKSANQITADTKQAIESYVGYVSELLRKYKRFVKEVNNETDTKTIDTMVQSHTIQIKTHQTVVKSLQEATQIKGTQSVQGLFSPPATTTPAVATTPVDPPKERPPGKFLALHRLDVLKKDLNDTKSDYDDLLKRYEGLVKECNQRWRSLDPKTVEAAKKALTDVQLKAQEVKKKTVTMVTQIAVLKKKMMARLFPTYNFATRSTERPRALNVLNPSMLSSEERQEIQKAKDFLKQVNEDVQLRKEALKRLTSEMNTVHQFADNAPKTAQDSASQKSDKTPKKWSTKKKVAVAAAAATVTAAAATVTAAVTAAVVASQQ